MLANNVKDDSLAASTGRGVSFFKPMVFVPKATSEKSVENAVKVAFVERLIYFSKTHSMFDTIDLVVDSWVRSNPEYAKAHYDMVEDKRRANFDEYGSNMTKKSGDSMNFRHLAEIPLEVYEVIDILYKTRISEIGKRKFWRQFAKRYSQFAPNEKI